MDSDRPHRSTSTNELFIFFASRLSSSSSMKISSSKSILSPGRSRDQSQISLSSSLSRRLRTNGSVKGGQASPMFPTTGKKRGCAFENPEPSSPKVTCIGQVRVKTKNKGRKLRSRSTRRGEISFRKVEQNSSYSNGGGGVEMEQQQSHLHMQFHNQLQHQECLRHRNQKWVHLPLTICEALRTFGADFNCFLPCRSSCLSTREKGVKAAGSANGSGRSSCGAVIARCLVALQEGEVKGKGREIELVVEEDEGRRDRGSQRRHVFEELVFKEEQNENGEEEEEKRVSVCVPPKNALLLMRCRSDPVKMAARANRFWESPTLDEEEEDENVVADGNRLDTEEENAQENEETEEEKIKMEQIIDDEVTVNCDSIETIIDAEGSEEGAIMAVELEEERNENTNIEEEEDEEDEDSANQLTQGNEQEAKLGSDSSEEVILIVQKLEENEYELTLPDSVRENEKELEDSKDEIAHLENADSEFESDSESDEEEEITVAELFREEDEEWIEEGSTDSQQEVLPECLLLMMCEPKLSMEVSKETWVCSTDFIRCLPERPAAVKKLVDSDDGVVPENKETEKRVSIDSNPAQPPQEEPRRQVQLMQPPRSSCSYPARTAVSSMAAMIEQKLVDAKAYEPFVLTRSKSEPRKASAKFAEPCYWKNRKLEPHRPATFGVGAAGVGF